MTPIISLKHIKVTVNSGTPLSHTIFDGLDLCIFPCEFVMIIGRNGAGKSSLFKLLAQELVAESGSMQIDSFPPLPLIKVLQDPAQGTVGNFTVQENLNFALKRGRGWGMYSSRGYTSYFKDLLGHIGLEARLTTPTKALSGGQRQALSLMMALITKAPIVLLDEITAALDVQMADFVMEYVTQSVYHQNRTVLAITHNIVHGLRYGNRLLIMDKGRIVKDYSKKEKERLVLSDVLKELDALV